MPAVQSKITVAENANWQAKGNAVIEPTIRVLEPGDEPAVEAFLQRHAEQSMFLRSNLAQAGLIDRGERFQGTWTAAFDGPSVVAVATVFWNGMMVLQAPTHLDAVVQRAARDAPRPLNGFVGPWEQADAARRRLGLHSAPMRRDTPEILYALDLRDLIVPDALVQHRLQCRLAREADVPTLVEWYVDYNAETLGVPKDAESHRQCTERVRDYTGAGTQWVVVDVTGEVTHGPAGRLVASSTFNATLPDCVQIGGVWTPPMWRGKGFARAVVAGSLMNAAKQGVERSILFTGHDNVAAQRAYVGIGFRAIGNYGLIIFDAPHDFRRPPATV